ncbi:MAG: 5-methyltetrahydropteroyltriglutamate--homocysteine methyltransferase [Alphaproteobacteria bacterium MarineAlpha6_Bin6]|nr:5-methyltetrahydropteroyltriglutamate--homocysteine S-methyltransferase [Pelagibacteraceae bacterium]PPR29521.1 MAG: 5-methyltetrahydropteroyltriglutamate--homocysteine methyltransferase [Alphaproteobacteria bacterium MarineAlpha6_Bin6]|tara:strand:+ start:21171 stop:23444 length:2274 start_codon:yes stop_codon:yes gene_type:complete
MILSSNLGYPRIGSNRELKWLLESFWKKEINEDYLFKKISEIKKSNWIKQKKSGINYIPSNDFSLYDHVLDMCLTLNVIPDRFNKLKKKNILDLYFAMARGYQNGKIDLKAMEMTKWFDTNYHYIVPEFKPNQNFKLSFYKIIDEFLEAKNFGIKTRPVILGPLSFLHLGKSASKKFNKFNLLSKLVPVYKQILKLLKDFGAEWVQIDEPILSLDLDGSLKKKFISTYKSLSKNSPKILLTSYFSSILPNYNLLKKLNVDGLHIDLVNTLNKDLDKILLNFPKNKLFSAGIINGRNIWKNDLSRSIEILRKIKRRIKDDKIIISSSCSLLHSPVSLDNERDLNANVKDWLAFADQKLIEIVFLQKYFNSNFLIKSNYLINNSISLKKRKNSKLINDQKVKKRIKSINSKMLSRNNKYFLRKMLQEELNLPLFPTTTIGSFPQTKEVRKLRLKYKKKEITKKTYENFLKRETKKAIKFQEKIDIDVIVHGEFERNDMVEYFGEKLKGFIFTKFGWVQSYGSRCVKPPIIFGDISRSKSMTVFWSKFAQSLTKKIVKGMLTGPVTILQWSFVRDDQPREITCKQIALALLDEVLDLEKNGLQIIQIDEPALREGLPLRKREWNNYLNWAIDSFKIASSSVKDETQIHTHMCYCEFDDILDSIEKLDADVISIETSRSNMELLDSFKAYKYPNSIGPGVYDIHSPRVPTAKEMKILLEKAKKYLDVDKIWVNPDCGLKTRGWPEVKKSLKSMTSVAKGLR